MSKFAPVILVPHYNHVAQFERFLPALLKSGQPIMVVDDGSSPDQLVALEALAAVHGFDIIRNPENLGKGETVMNGFLAAAGKGYTHALQIDADGQHESADLPLLLDRACAAPGTLVCGEPVFGPEMPAARRWGRKLTDFFVVIETLSFQIRDAMCGLRVYPLEQTLRLIQWKRPGARMDFDTEILVAAYWMGLSIEFVQTRVRYPEEGLSHFHYFADNVRITAMHARLILGMIPRIPNLVVRNRQRNRQQS